MNFPETLKYTKDHEWIRFNGAEAFIGITDFAQGELGDIVFIEVNSIGETLKQESIFGTVEAVKTVSDLFMPVSGTIIELNPKVQSTPELVNKDPYGAGWLIKIIFNNSAEIPGLLNADEYKALIGK